jgi:hypothetical protein
VQRTGWAASPVLAALIAVTAAMAGHAASARRWQAVDRGVEDARPLLSARFDGTTLTFHVEPGAGNAVEFELTLPGAGRAILRRFAGCGNAAVKLETMREN